VKHALAFPQDPEKVATELPRKRGAQGSVILSDPVHAPAGPESNDVDVAATVAATLASAKARKFFYVFLDHQV